MPRRTLQRNHRCNRPILLAARTGQRNRRARRASAQARAPSRHKPAAAPWRSSRTTRRSNHWIQRKSVIALRTPWTNPNEAGPCSLRAGTIRTAISAAKPLTQYPCGGSQRKAGARRTCAISTMLHRSKSHQSEKKRSHHPNAVIIRRSPHGGEERITRGPARRAVGSEKTKGESERLFVCVDLCAVNIAVCVTGGQR